MEAHPLAALQVESVRVKRDLWFTEDELSRLDLCAQGIETGDIYVKSELAVLTKENRRKPFTDGELQRIDEMKRLFCASVTAEVVTMIQNEMFNLK